MKLVLAAFAPVVLAAAASAASTHYPDYAGGSGTCLDLTTTPAAGSNAYLAVAASGFLEADLASCCVRYFLSAYNSCITTGGGTVVGTGRYYAAWDQSPHTCAKDCAASTTDQACGGVLGPGVGTTHASAAACCAAHFASQTPEYCAALTNGVAYAGTDKYYLDSSENMCVKDCASGASCGGVATGSWNALYATVAACCAARLPSLDAAFCANQSTATAGSAAAGTNKWHVEGSVCKKDCTGTGAECAPATAYDYLYDDAAKCCAGGLGHVKPDWCLSRSDPATFGVSGTAFTHKWFVDYGANVCKKDCDAAGDATCDKTGLKESTEPYATAAACCAAKLNWIDAASCAGSSSVAVAASASAAGSSKWHPDFATSPARCVLDCPTNAAAPACAGVVENAAGVSFYSSVTDCCAQKFQWVNPSMCQALSVAGKGNAAHTDLFYADYGSNICVKDCAAGTTGCAGSPGSLSEKLYATAKECCKLKLGWIDAGACEGSSTAAAASSAAAAVAAAGTSKWYAEYSGSKCVKDCAAGSDQACAGVVANTAGLQLYDSDTKCCASKFSYVDASLCKARSDGTGHTNKYYPDTSKNVCVQDCEAGPARFAGCGGAPSNLSIKLYADAKACCSGSLGWVDSNSCQSIATPALLAVIANGTSKWHADYGGSKCVKDCPAGSDQACTGVVANTAGLQLYDTETQCCAGKFSYINASLCKARSDGTGHTNLFYASASVCVKDCAAGGAGCGGAPSNTSVKLFSSAKTCCSSSLGWVDANSCQGIAATPAAASATAATGSTKWYVNWSLGKCAQDCAGSGACGGLAKNWDTTYVSAAACCQSSSMSWKKLSECQKA